MSLSCTLMYAGVKKTGAEGYVKALVGVFITILLVAVFGLAFRSTIVGNMCKISAPYDVTYTAPNGSSMTESFDASGVDCQTNGLVYTYGLIILGLLAVVGLIYTAVKGSKK